MKLLLIFLVVFCGQLFAASDVEMLPRVMGELKKDLDASKTWGDFLTRKPMLRASDMVILNQTVGLDSKLPSYDISANLRTFKAGNHTLEIVNLGTMDFKIDGKPFRYDANESIYESMYRLKKQKTISLFNRFFFEEAHAKEVGSICDTKLLSQLFTEDGLKKEAKNTAMNLVSVIGAAIHYNYQMGTDSKSERAERCEDIVRSLQDNQGSSRLIEVDCGGTLSAKQNLKFRVPGLGGTKEQIENTFGTSDPYRKQDTKSKGQRSCSVEMDIYVNWNARELASRDFKKAYRYDENGNVVETMMVEKTSDGNVQTRCMPGGDNDLAKNVQLKMITPTLINFSRKGICHLKNDCLNQVKALAQKNKIELQKGMDQGSINDCGNEAKLEQSAKCVTHWENFEKINCYSETVKGIACARPARNLRKAECTNKQLAEMRKGPGPVVPAAARPTR